MASSRDREGYILVDRNMCEWQWWQKHNTVIVFLWLLMKAQFHDSTFCGVEVKRGQVVTTHAKIMQHNKMTKQEVRTAISNLKSTHAITIERYSRFIVITIVNYDEYQNLTMKSTRKQQSNNNQTTIKQQYTNTYNTDNTLNAEKTRSARHPLPRTEEEIVPEIDMEGYPDFEHMPSEADGTKRDIPPRLRKLFDGDYGAFWRYMKRCSMK
jgi:hypothetical protein